MKNIKKISGVLLLTLLLLPATAFGGVNVSGSGGVDPQTSIFGLSDEDGPYSIGDDMQLQLLLANSANEILDGAAVDLVIWAEDTDNPGAPSSAFMAKLGNQSLSAGTAMGEYAYVAYGLSNGVEDLYGSFIRPGNYNVYGALLGDIGSGATVKEVVNNTTRLRSTQIRPAVDPTPEIEPETPDQAPAPTPEPESITIVMNLGNQTIQKQGQISKMDTAPIIREGRTYIPFRALGEALGAKVDYSPSAGIVTAILDDRTITMALGSDIMMVDKLSVTMSAQPFIENGRTMIPVRVAAEAFGFEVQAVSNAQGMVTDILFTK